MRLSQVSVGQRDLNLMEGGLLILVCMIHLASRAHSDRIDGDGSGEKRFNAQGKFRLCYEAGLQHSLTEGNTQILGQPLYLFAG